MFLAFKAALVVELAHRIPRGRHRSRWKTNSPRKRTNGCVMGSWQASGKCVFALLALLEAEVAWGEDLEGEFGEGV